MTAVALRPERLGLSDLDRVVLAPHVEQQLAHAAAKGQGSPSWVARKKTEGRDLLALEVIAPRMQVLALDLTTELLALVRLQGAAPCLPPDADGLVVEHQIDLALRYPPEILTTPLPGPALVQILRPQYVHHPNVGAGPSQALCLGASIPIGLPLREVVLASYAALTLQSIQLDERDSAGVMNRAAALYWQANTHRIPLSRDRFLDEIEDTHESPKENRT